MPLAAPCVAGRLDPANARHVLAMLDRAIDGRAQRRVRRHGHGARAEERDQRRRRAVHRPHRVSRRAHPRRAPGDAAGGRHRCAWRWPPRTCRCAPSATRSRPRCSTPRCDILHDDVRAAVGHLAAAHRGLRPESARRRKRPSRHRGSRRDRARHRARARRRHAGRRPAARRHRVRAAHCSRTTTWCSPCTTTRACRCSSTPASATPSTSRWACPSCAPRWTTAPRSISPAPGRADAGSLVAATRLAIEFAARRAGPQ